MKENMKAAVAKYTSEIYDPEGRWIIPEPDVDAESKLREIMGTDIPVELLQLYSCCNGIGYTISFGVSEIDWYVPRIDDLPTLIEEGRNWFAGTHPRLASRFFPVFDEGGDYSGYIKNTRGAWEKSIFCFMHDCYLFEKKQKVREFMIDFNEPLSVYLREC